MERIRIKYGIAALSILFAAFMFSACQKEEQKVAKAVLASAGALNFDAQNAPSQIITVYSDAEWVADVPEWITIEPCTGSGVVDVTVSVSDNIRGGTLDTPRKDDLVFRGNTLSSRAVVVVSQVGDKYRDVGNSTITEVVNSKDETVVIVPEAQVAALTSDGVVVTDGKSNLLVKTGTSLVLGDVVSFRGTKISEESLPTIAECDEFIKKSDGVLTLGEPKDITEQIADYSASSREYVTFRGVLRGTSVQIADIVRTVSLVSPHSSLDVSSMNGHRVIVKGYYSGATPSYINVIASEITSLGPSEIIYWFDDFSWVTPYAEDYIAKGGTSSKPTVDDCVKDKLSTDKGCPNIYTDCVNLGVNVLADLRSRGYEDLNTDFKTIYMQKHYFKYGATNKQSGLVLPPFDGKTPVEDEITVSFDWCNYMSSKGAIDVAEMVVKIDGPGYVVTASGSETAKVSDHILTTQKEGELFWITSTVTIRNATTDTRITISPAFLDGQQQSGTSTYMRYYMDNIKVSAEIKE